MAIFGIFEKESYDLFKASGLNDINQMLALAFYRDWETFPVQLVGSVRSVIVALSII